MEGKNKIKRIVVFGPPASGKGTQAGLIAKKLKIPHISAGQVLRDIASSKNSKLSQQITRYIKGGKLLPDDLVNGLLLKHLKKLKFKGGFVLDGYPRTKGQFLVAKDKIKITNAFLIDIGDKEATRRIVGRRSCKNGHIFNTQTKKPKKQGVCDNCGEKLIKRVDDNAKVIKNRLKIYHQEMDSVLDYYNKTGLLRTVNGEQEIDKIFKDISKYLK